MASSALSARLRTPLCCAIDLSPREFDARDGDLGGVGLFSDDVPKAPGTERRRIGGRVPTSRRTSARARRDFPCVTVRPRGAGG
jgi:hypothetical protein